MIRWFNIEYIWIVLDYFKFYMVYMIFYCMMNMCGNLEINWLFIVCIVYIIVILVLSCDILLYMIRLFYWFVGLKLVGLYFFDFMFLMKWNLYLRNVWYWSLRLKLIFFVLFIVWLFLLFVFINYCCLIFFKLNVFYWILVVVN